MKVPILSVLLICKEFLYINLILLVIFLNKVGLCGQSSQLIGLVFDRRSKSGLFRYTNIYRDSHVVPR